MAIVTIIGAGSVGATVAYTLVATGTVAEIVLIDVNEAKAKGEAMDILQATPYLHPTKIYYGTYEDAAGSDIVIVTSGVGSWGMPMRVGTNCEIVSISFTCKK